MRAEVIEVILTTDRRGDGTPGDPIRLIKQYWSLDGELLWEEPDPCSGVSSEVALEERRRQRKEGR